MKEDTNNIEKAKCYIGKRISEMLNDGDVVNLGIGIPTYAARYLKKDSEVYLQSENGLLRMGENPAKDEYDWDLVNAGGEPSSIRKGGAFFDSSLSFCYIRGGVIDITVLGALEVDEKGNIASWMIPSKMFAGVGGAMDLISGAKKVIAAFTHTTKDNKPKIVKACHFPLTGINCVSTIVTEKCIMEFINGRLTLTELAPLVSIEYIRDTVSASFEVSDKLVRR